jgi:hypothetical protein
MCLTSYVEIRWKCSFVSRKEGADGQPSSNYNLNGEWAKE